MKIKLINDTKTLELTKENSSEKNYFKFDYYSSKDAIPELKAHQLVCGSYVKTHYIPDFSKAISEIRIYAGEDAWERSKLYQELIMYSRINIDIEIVAERKIFSNMTLVNDFSYEYNYSCIFKGGCGMSI